MDENIEYMMALAADARESGAEETVDAHLSEHSSGPGGYDQ